MKNREREREKNSFCQFNLKYFICSLNWCSFVNIYIYKLIFISFVRTLVKKKNRFNQN